MSIQDHHSWDDVEICSVEIAQYLSDLSNWEQPLFPDVEGCSNLNPDPGYFNVTSTMWMCDNQITGNATVPYFKQIL